MAGGSLAIRVVRRLWAENLQEITREKLWYIALEEGATSSSTIYQTINLLKTLRAIIPRANGKIFRINRKILELILGESKEEGGDKL